MAHMKNFLPHTSFSELFVFNTCRYRWYKEKVEGVDAEPTKAMNKGKIGHKWFEFYYVYPNPSEKTREWINQNEEFMTEERELLLELFEELEPVLENYKAYHQEPEGLVDTEKELMVSLPIKIPIYERKNKNSKRPPRATFYIRMFIDAIIQDKEGNYWAVEHKFTSQMYKEDYLARHPQARMYVWGLNRMKYKLGFEVKGLIINQVKAKPLAEPKILKSGKVSVSGRNVTGKQLEKFLEENNIDKAPYQDKIQELNQPNNLEKFFKTDTIWLTPEQEKAIEHNIIQNVRDYRDRTKKIYRHFGQHCSYCNIKEQCENELNNGVI